MRVLVCGGGFVGTYAALRLERRLRGPGDEIVLVNAENYLQYQPFLPEAASGTIEPRHVVVALRRRPPPHPARRRRGGVGRPRRPPGPGRISSRVDRSTSHYDVLVLAPGSVSRVLAGARDSPSTPSASRRSTRRSTSATTSWRGSRPPPRPPTPRGGGRCSRSSFVGGGYAGVEALAELEDLSRAALEALPRAPRRARPVGADRGHGSPPPRDRREPRRVRRSVA